MKSLKELIAEREKAVISAKKSVVEAQRRVAAAEQELAQVKAGNIVRCPVCKGSGNKCVYVGCDCTRSHPYDVLNCEVCRGRGYLVPNVE